MNFIEVKNLEKVFLSEFLRRPIKVLDNITFSVPQGTTFGVLGPNGAGKTTTMKIILGLLKPTSGEVNIMGKHSTDKKSREQIGYMPENPYFYSYLNGYELLSFCAELLGLQGKKKKERVEELLDLVGMSSRAYTRLGKSSKGMLQRISIAQALINDPEFLLLDEPMSGLDPLGRKEIKDIILSLKARNKTIFFNSHILSDVEDLCDSIAILKMGKLVASDTLENIRQLKGFNTLEEFFIHKIKEDSEDIKPQVITAGAGEK
jgi:ABC-2 type transport system ATP-binding protein